MIDIISYMNLYIFQLRSFDFSKKKCKTTRINIHLVPLKAGKGAAMMGSDHTARRNGISYFTIEPCKEGGQAHEPGHRS